MMRVDVQDPWGLVVLASFVLAGFALLWWLIAAMLRTTGRGAFSLLGFAAFVYLAGGIAGTAARVMATPPPAPEPTPPGPVKVLQAEVPTDPDRPTPPASDATAGAPSSAKGPELAPLPSVELPAPTRSGRAALAFVDDISHDPRKCGDAEQVAVAARELPGAASEVAPARLEKAAFKLEQCRRKLIWARAYTVQHDHVTAREAFAEAVRKRLGDQGIAVLVTLRGAAKERIRMGGEKLDEARARGLLDGGLRDELIAAGFADVTLANLQGSVHESLEVPSDQALAERELERYGLGSAITGR